MIEVILFAAVAFFFALVVWFATSPLRRYRPMVPDVTAGFAAISTEITDDAVGEIVIYVKDSVHVLRSRESETWRNLAGQLNMLADQIDFLTGEGTDQ